MTLVPQAFAAAWKHFQAGQWLQAEQYYRQILQADPNQVEALHFLGVRLFDSASWSPS